ncbi:MAG: TrkH family potassium uptake protein [Geminicoccaceae bacterium]|nr:TrkH family potassium uptake protein [Geminicoccaceae bacterium]MDW8124724.1 TrkH family potassium uptake protein [Geminicoccaceae bacterium]
MSASPVRPRLERAKPAQRPAERFRAEPAERPGLARARYATVAHAVGWLLVVLAAAMLPPMALDLADDNRDWTGFAAAAALTGFVGVALLLASRGPEPALDVRSAFLLTAASWLAVSAFGALPFVFGVAHLSFTDAVFETVSGLTTTGSTVITGLDSAPRGLLLWRALLQWMGGIGIVVVGLVILPFLRVGGMQLFRTESSDRSDKLLASTAAIAARMLAVYLVLTLACFLALDAVGLSLFDALLHAMTALSTGGYSSRDASIGAFANPAAEWVLVIAMLAGALTFTRYLALVLGRPHLFFGDPQIRLLLLIVLTLSAILALWLVFVHERPLPSAVRAALFAVVAVITTTGFVAEDWQEWGAPVLGLFLIVTVLGGCTGSTAGGIKVFRVQILASATLAYLAGLLHPNRVVPIRWGDRQVEPELVLAVLSFVFLFVGSWALFTVLLSGLGLDLVTAVSGAATALANVGPGLGPVIGPSGNFASLSDAAKWVLVLAMLLGRLEFFTLLALLHPVFWRR